MKRKIVMLILSVVSIIWFTLSWDLAGFSVSVNPSAVKMWEPVDLTIKALDSNWDVLTDYNGYIVITVTDKDGNDIEPSNYTVPNDWTYEFNEEDQWVKKFTKWLIISQVWDFYVQVQDFDGWKTWQASIKVVNANALPSAWKVKVVTPAENEIITSESMTVAWEAKNYKNSKIKVLIDNKEVAEDLVDNNWNFQVTIAWTQNWKHVLKVDVLDLDWKVVAKSDDIDFQMKAEDTLFKKLEILPSNKVMQWTKITANLEVSPNVNSAILHIDKYGDFPMDKTSTTSFSTQFIANIPWTFNISLTLRTSTEKKHDYKNIEKLAVLEKIAITDVRYVRDNNANKIDLDWKYIWTVHYFKVLYWTSRNNLSESVIVPINKYTITNVDPAATYYVRIIPVDWWWKQIWDPSKLVVIEPNLKQSATCMVDNIKVNVIKRNWSNWLVWGKVDWAIGYIVYQWDTPNDFSPTATLTWTEYKLPYDPNAKKVTYSYFVVKAKCDDWMHQIWDVKKVKTWPLDWLIYAFIISMIFYWLKLVKESY